MDRIKGVRSPIAFSIWLRVCCRRWCSSSMVSMGALFLGDGFVVGVGVG